MATTKRSYLDPIHQDIILDRSKPEQRLLIDLIDTPEFQRLRRIHQLGVSFFTFQGAEGSRFTHSVGVMHVASRLLSLLAEKTPSIEDQKPLILATALLHDLGHGPFSHVTEKIANYDHEDWSCRIIAGDTVVNRVLAGFERDLPEKMTSVLKKKYKPAYVCHIVSSQLDCDRFDYLLRDSYMTGTAYGLFALQRILSSLEIDETGDRIVVSGEKGQTAVEDYLFARYSMYAQVYYHKKNLASRVLLGKIMDRARHLADKVCFWDEPTRKWLTGEPLSVNEYLQLDDIQLTYHIKRWVEDPDAILADLAGRFVNRRLFIATRLASGQNELVADAEAHARQVVASLGFDPDYYVATESSGIRPYDYYRPDAASPQTNIMVRTENGTIRELSTISSTVEALVKGDFESHWLIYPAEAREELSALRELAPAP